MESHIEMVVSSSCPLIIQRKKKKEWHHSEDNKEGNVVIIRLSNYEPTFNHLTTAINILQRDWTGWLTD